VAQSAMDAAQLFIGVLPHRELKTKRSGASGASRGTGARPLRGGGAVLTNVDTVPGTPVHRRMSLSPGTVGHSRMLRSGRPRFGDDGSSQRSTVPGDSRSGTVGRARPTRGRWPPIARDIRSWKPSARSCSTSVLVRFAAAARGRIGVVRVRCGARRTTAVRCSRLGERGEMTGNRRAVRAPARASRRLVRPTQFPEAVSYIEG